jgi:hypothetical protein
MVELYKDRHKLVVSCLTNQPDVTDDILCLEIYDCFELAYVCYSLHQSPICCANQVIHVCDHRCLRRIVSPPVGWPVVN